jgi:D-alanyl-D-alanine endopeptidase (penicillin-binding protein 7)
VALVVDQDTDEVLFSKNPRRAADRVDHQADDRAGGHRSQACRWTKTITITQDDIDTEKGSRSRLRWAPSSPAARCCTWP